VAGGTVAGGAAGGNVEGGRVAGGPGDATDTTGAEVGAGGVVVFTTGARVAAGAAGLLAGRVVVDRGGVVAATSVRRAGGLLVVEVPGTENPDRVAIRVGAWPDVAEHALSTMIAARAAGLRPRESTPGSRPDWRRP